MDVSAAQSGGSVVVRGGVEPPTFRFSGIASCSGSCLRPLTWAESSTCGSCLYQLKWRAFGAPGRPPAPDMLSPSKLPVKGTAYGRVPPLRSGQTLDCELPRQDPAPAGRAGKTRVGLKAGLSHPMVGAHGHARS